MNTAILNHLVQSTVFATVCGLLTLVLRKNRAHVRYALWTAASAKFLVPFSALVALGGLVGHWLLPATTGHRFAIVLEQVAQPLARTAVPAAARVPGLME